MTDFTDDGRQPDGAALGVIDPGTGHTSPLALLHTHLEVQAWGPCVQVAATYVFAPPARAGHPVEARFRLPAMPGAQVYGAAVRIGDTAHAAALVDAGRPEALPPGADGVVGFLGRQGFRLNLSGLALSGDIALTVRWVQQADPDGVGWCVRVPAAERIGFVAHGAEDVVGSGTAWAPDGTGLVVGPIDRPRTLYWRYHQDAAHPRLVVYDQPDAGEVLGLAVVLPPRRWWPKPSREVTIAIDEAIAPGGHGQAVVEGILAGMTGLDVVHIASGGDLSAPAGPPSRCRQTFVITDGTRWDAAALLAWAQLEAGEPEPRRLIAIGLGADFPHDLAFQLGRLTGGGAINLDVTAGPTAISAELDEFLEPFEAPLLMGLTIGDGDPASSTTLPLGDLPPRRPAWRPFRHSASIAHWCVRDREGDPRARATPIRVEPPGVLAAYIALIAGVSAQGPDARLRVV